MKHIKIFEDFNSGIFTDQEIIDHITDITPDDSDVPDWSFEHQIKGRSFKAEKVNLEDLLKSDPSFKEYFDSGEERYDQDEMDSNTLDNEIVVVDGNLVDGYSRSSTLLRQGEKYAYGFVAVPKDERNS